MNNDIKKICREEALREAEYIMAEVNADPTLNDVKAPEEIYDRLFAQIGKHEEKRAYENLSESDKELIQLGKVYKKRRKRNKILLVAAIMILTLAFGTVCIGKGEGIFDSISRKFVEREQIIIDSENVEPIDFIEENEIYEQIESQFGLNPVKLEYLPKGVSFQEATLGNAIQKINIIYGTKTEANIIYVIRPNYRDGSYGTDIEDEMIQEYKKQVDDTEITINQYLIKESKEYRWTVRFVYQDAHYFLIITGIEQEEVEKIVDNFYFP